MARSNLVTVGKIQRVQSSSVLVFHPRTRLVYKTRLRARYSACDVTPPYLLRRNGLHHRGVLSKNIIFLSHKNLPSKPSPILISRLTRLLITTRVSSFLGKFPFMTESEKYFLWIASVITNRSQDLKIQLADLFKRRL